MARASGCFCSEQKFLHGRHYNDRFTKYFARLLHLMPGIGNFTHGHFSSFPFGENRVFHENVFVVADEDVILTAAGSVTGAKVKTT